MLELRDDRRPAAEVSVEAGRRVVRAEADALARLADALPEGFGEAVALILDAPGRVIVAGMGKSGHVARKIAATMASTGTRASFVHPAEASHGDLGMIGPGDVCLLISNSGETPELADLIAYAARFDIPLIAISSREGSTLMRAAHVPLCLPQAPEACPMGLAPTTSTTLMLALGDALAVAAMEARGFAPADFATFHPGGKLGAGLKRVGDLMHGGAALPLVAPETPMADVLEAMTAKGFGAALVAGADGRLAGIVTDGDLRRNIAGLMDRRAGDVATPNPATVTPDTLAAAALALLDERRISVLPVMGGDGRPVGVLRTLDLLRAGVV